MVVRNRETPKTISGLHIEYVPPLHMCIQTYTQINKLNGREQQQQQNVLHPEESDGWKKQQLFSKHYVQGAISTA